MESLLTAAVTGVVTGLIAWGGIRVELQWLRRDVDEAKARADHAHERIDEFLLERS